VFFAEELKYFIIKRTRIEFQIFLFGDINFSKTIIYKHKYEKVGFRGSGFLSDFHLFCSTADEDWDKNHLFHLFSDF